MQEYYDEIDNEVSLVEVFKVAFGRFKKARIRFGIIAGSVLIILFIGLGIIYNNYAQYYSASFNYLIPSLQEKTNQTGEVISVSYLDGTPFPSSTLISKANLSAVKASSSEYSDVDITGMFDQNECKVVFDGKEVYKYTISIKKKYFSDKDQATEFIKGLATLPVKNTRNLIDSTDNDLFLTQATQEGISLDDELTYLKYQANHIINTYKSFLYTTKTTTNADGSTTTTTVQNNVAVIVSGKLTPVSDLLVDAQAKIDDLNLDLLLTEIQNKGYVRNFADPEVQAEIMAKLERYQAQKEMLTKKRDTYKVSYAGTNLSETESDNYNKIVNELAEVEHIVDVYTNYATGQDSAPIEDEVFEAVSILKDITYRLDEVQRGIYNSNSLNDNLVDYKKNTIVEKTGGINILIAGALALIAGLIVAGIVNLIIDLGKYKEEKINGNKKENEVKKETN